MRVVEVKLLKPLDMVRASVSVLTIPGRCLVTTAARVRDKEGDLPSASPGDRKRQEIGFLGSKDAYGKTRGPIPAIPSPSFLSAILVVLLKHLNDL